MLPVLMVAVVAAVPVNVVAVKGEPAALVRAKLEDPKARLLDASSLRASLAGDGPMSVQFFEQFNAKPTAGWPPSLNDTWSEGLAHCRTIAGPIPWKQTDAVNAMACANRLSEFLWQRYVAQAGAAVVYEVTLLETRTEFIVIGRAWEPGQATVLESTERGGPGDKEKLIDRVTTALREKKAPLKPREVVTELVSKSFVDPWVNEAPFTGPLQLDKSCAKLPTKLTFARPGRWRSRSRRAGRRPTPRGPRPSAASPSRSTKRRSAA